MRCVWDGAGRGSAPFGERPTSLTERVLAPPGPVQTHVPRQSKAEREEVQTRDASVVTPTGPTSSSLWAIIAKTFQNAHTFLNTLRSINKHDYNDLVKTQLYSPLA